MGGDAHAKKAGAHRTGKRIEARSIDAELLIQVELTIVDLALVANLKHQNDEKVVLETAYEPVVAHAVAPQASEVHAHRRLFTGVQCGKVGSIMLP